jgi:hemoglobin
MTTLTEDKLRALVRAFYARIREDADLGPVFNEVVTGWPEHLEKLTGFWAKMMLGSGAYQGNPMQVHHRLRERLSPALFARWLALWGEVSGETLSAADAAAVQERAARMAVNLQRGCGVLPG